MIEFAGGSGVKDELTTVQPGALTTAVSTVEVGSGDGGEVGSDSTLVAAGGVAVDSIDDTGWHAKMKAARDDRIKNKGNLRINTKISPFGCVTFRINPKNLVSFPFYQDFPKLEYAIGTGLGPRGVVWEVRRKHSSQITPLLRQHFT
jgi:hypothetical protein